MRRADDWVIIGYSMPPEDPAIRSLFIRAFYGRVSPPRLTVVQKGLDPKTVAAYRILFPALDLIRDYRQDGLEGFLGRL